MIQTKNLPIELQEDFKLITFGNNYHLIGSASVNSITYSSDYDLNEKIIVTDKQLKDHINLIKKHKNIWLVDFHNTKEYIQINTIANINGILTDINNTIFVNSQPTKKKKEILLKKDIHELINNKNYFKSVKRMYSLISLSPRKNKIMINYLTEFLNSNIGLLSNIVNQLTIIKNFSKTVGLDFNKNKIANEPRLIFDNLEICKLKLNKVYVVKIEDELFKMFNLKLIDKLISILDKKLQDYVFDFININRKLFNV